MVREIEDRQVPSDREFEVLSELAKTARAEPGVSAEKSREGFEERRIAFEKRLLAE